MPERVLCEVSLDRLNRAGCLAREAEGQEILFVQTREGVRAYSGVCPHLGGPLLQARVRDERIRCPWHSYEFDAVDGRCLSVPGRPWRGLPSRRPAGPPADLRLVPLPLRIRDGAVQVTRSED